MRSGAYIETATLPSGLGLEAAGLVERIGLGVQGFEPGDPVSVLPPKSMVRWPAYGELATFPAALLARHPPSLTWEEAAAVWMQYLTAYGGLVDIGGLRRGDFVVITAASSSVGLAAIQIANRIGAIPVAVTRTSAKRQLLLEAGAAHGRSAKRFEDFRRVLPIPDLILQKRRSHFGCRGLSSPRRDHRWGPPIGCSGRPRTSRGGTDPGHRNSHRASCEDRHTGRACCDRARPRGRAPSAP